MTRWQLQIWTHFEVVQQVSAGDFDSSDLFFHQVFWREQRRDEAHQLLFKLLINIWDTHQTHIRKTDSLNTTLLHFQACSSHSEFTAQSVWTGPMTTDTIHVVCEFCIKSDLRRTPPLTCSIFKQELDFLKCWQRLVSAGTSKEGNESKNWWMMWNMGSKGGQCELNQSLLHIKVLNQCLQPCLNLVLLICTPCFIFL